MTDDTDTAATDGRTGTSRRDFVRAASAGAGALAVGAGASTTAGASQGDGPGQSIGTPRLGTEGNRIVDPDGNTVKLRGLNVADPKLQDVTAQQRGKTAVQTIDFLTNSDLGWHPRVIRLPIEPGNVAEIAPVPVADYENGDYPIDAFDEDDLLAYCENHLDDVVDRCAERNVYCIVDYHRHWGSGKQQWDDPNLHSELIRFWDVMAARYGDREHVLFEVYNEPTEPGVWGDVLDDSDGDPEHWQGNWLDWKDVCQPWVDTIREHTDNLIIVGSPGWSSSPEGALFEPFDGENLAYTYHIYGGHVVSMNQNWDQNGIDAQGLAAGGTPVYEEYPVFVTEFGWERLSITDQHIQGTTEDFGEPFIEFIESHDAISWTAWCADPIWRPIMFRREWIDEDVIYDPEHMDAVGDPYSEDLQVYCEEPPCPWTLMEDGWEGMPWSGDTIKQTLEDVKDDLVPEGDGGTAPSSPSSVSVESTTSSTIEVSWTGVADATSYVVSRDGNQVDTTTDTSYQLTGLAPETSYTIGVASRNGDGTSSSTTVTGTTGGDGTDGCTDDAVDAAEVDGQWVCDVSGDELYRDVNADGEVGQDDVVHFFENQHREAWKRPDLFDFSESGSVGHGDVVALFEDVVVG